jgi:hypothetical protein
MSATRWHMCMVVKGALRQTDRELEGLIDDDDGHPVSGTVARAWLKIQAYQGREVVPFGEACDGFDFKTGCPGHQVEDAAQLARPAIYRPRPTQLVLAIAPLSIAE